MRDNEQRTNVNRCKCGSYQLKVMDSREHGCEIWRTRLCTECGKRIYTKEVCRNEIDNNEKYKKVVEHLKALEKLLRGLD